MSQEKRKLMKSSVIALSDTCPRAQALSDDAFHCSFWRLRDGSRSHVGNRPAIASRMIGEFQWDYVVASWPRMPSQCHGATQTLVLSTASSEKCEVVTRRASHEAQFVIHKISLSRRHPVFCGHHRRGWFTTVRESCIPIVLGPHIIKRWYMNRRSNSTYVSS